MSVSMTNVPWPQVKLHLLTGSKGYYIERDGWFTVVLPDARCQCEFPDEIVLRDSPGLLEGYCVDWAEDFRKSYRSFLIRSELSTEHSESAPSIA